MKSFALPLGLLAVTAFTAAPGLALAQQADLPMAPPAQAQQYAPQQAPAPQADEQQAQPTQAVPPVPAVPSQPAPAAYQASGDQQMQAPANWRYDYPTGSWVYTTDNGWIWIPANTTTEIVDETPYAYMYTPAYGWTYYASPWGFGPYHYGPWVTAAWHPYGWSGGWAHGPLYGRGGLGYGRGIGYGYGGYRGGAVGYGRGGVVGRPGYGGGHGAPAYGGGVHVGGGGGGRGGGGFHGGGGHGGGGHGGHR